MERTSKVNRNTNETKVEVSLTLDGKGDHDIQTSIPFLDHMIAQLARHGLFDLTVKAEGDTYIDCHHTVEDIGIALGQAFKEALGDKKAFAGSPTPAFLSTKRWRIASSISAEDPFSFSTLIFPNPRSANLTWNWCRYSFRPSR